MIPKKLRIWSNHDKKYLTPELWAFALSGVFLNRPNIFWPFTPTDFLSDGFVVEQFIGIQDKNGLDIYEGDVIVCHQFDDIRFIVKYSTESVGFIFKSENGHYLTNEHFNKIEVIGNIHANE